MYSAKIQNLLRGIKPGQEVRIAARGKTYEGVLMPRPDFGDPNCLVLKLNNGYNIGLKYEPGMKITASRITPREIEKEAEIELGKRKKIAKLEFNKNRPPVTLVTTGGTITSRVDYKTGAVTALMGPDELLSVAPELAGIVNLRHVLNPFSMMSENIFYDEWAEIAKTAAKELNVGDAGVIITHGTDTLHYTAAALSFMLKTSKPVVLVGAQRSSDRGSSDAAMNLICSAHAAISDIAEVGICMHGSMDDDYCLFNRGTKVRKMNTSRRDTFRPINSLPLAAIWPNGKIQKMSEHKKRSDDDVELDIKFEPRVALVKSYPGSNPELINFYVEKGCKGIVVEATGLGQVPTEGVRDKKRNWLPNIAKAVKQGVSIAFAAQTLYGRLDPYVYSEARLALKEGVIYCEDMLPETAYVKLGWALGHTQDADEVKKMMLHNYAGEISKRTLPETFLY